MSDPLFIEQIYSGTGKLREKYKTTTYPMLAPGAMIATSDHELHRRRRETVNQLFSKQSVKRIEPILQKTMWKLLQRMEEWGTTGSPAPMSLAFKAATKDVISNYGFGESSSSSLDRDDLDQTYFKAIPQGRGVFFTLYFHWLAEMMIKMPLFMVLILNPPLADFIKFVDVRHIYSVATFEPLILTLGLSERIAEIKASNNYDPEFPTIIHKILNSKIPDSEKEVTRVAEEAYVILIAGTDTTAGTMAAICYLLLTKPEILKKVKAELRAVIPDAEKLPSCADLNSLTYLVSPLYFCTD
jgi:cytochrome P450